jgi:hypothetical protein
MFGSNGSNSEVSPAQRHVRSPSGADIAEPHGQIRFVPTTGYTHQQDGPLAGSRLAVGGVDDAAAVPLPLWVAAIRIWLRANGSMP